jgi:CubicO group peptidase (beta-lactamase class C family)
MADGFGRFAGNGLSFAVPNAPSFFEGLPTAGLREQTFIVTLPGGTQTIATSDPGRGAITGDVREFGRFDVPTLFGIASTARTFTTTAPPPWRTSSDTTSGCSIS